MKNIVERQAQFSSLLAKIVVRVSISNWLNQRQWRAKFICLIVLSIVLVSILLLEWGKYCACLKPSMFQYCGISSFKSFLWFAFISKGSTSSWGFFKTFLEIAPNLWDLCRLSLSLLFSLLLDLDDSPSPVVSRLYNFKPTINTLQYHFARLTIDLVSL